MSVVFTGTNQGSFVSTGKPVTIQVPQGIDYITVYNQTVLNSTTIGTSAGAWFYWQNGMTSGQGTEFQKLGGVANKPITTLQIAAGAGFIPVNNTVNNPGASVAITSITNATPPVVATGSTAGLIANSSIVRIFNVTGAQQLGGIDFTVGTIVANTSFTLAYMASIAAATTGSYRIIPYDPYFYPRNRYITKISQATQAIVTLSVNHSYTVGQEVRFVIPEVTAAAFGMVELNGLKGTIVAVGQADADGVTNTITVDIDTSGFTAFAWPLTTDPSFTPAQIVPVGENTAEALNLSANILGDATINQGYIGMILEAGADSPAGQNGDVIYWVAGKSWNM